MPDVYGSEPDMSPKRAMSRRQEVVHQVLRISLPDLGINELDA